MENAVFAFRLEGEPVECRALGHGHINSTFKITTDRGRQYVLQRINRNVFRDPAALMDNGGAVTDFIRQHAGVTLHYLATREGKLYHQDGQGEYWRMYDFIAGFCLDLPESAEDFYQSALAFGRFQELLAEFPAQTLRETIPNFHNTIDRYQKFRRAVEADSSNRLAMVGEEVEFFVEREERATWLQRMREAGELPLRVTHNDTTLNNVLLDPTTRKALCVLDLDTVMPGLSAYDFGDAIRSGAATAAEDETDLTKMELDLNLFRAFTRGFLEAAVSLTDREVEVLPLGAYVMTLETAMRFLTDYLEGDVYYKTQYPDHNLIRARSQMKLLSDMERKMDEMERIVAEIRK